MKLFNGQVETVGKKFWKVRIHTAIFGNTIAIRERILHEAIKNNKLLIVECENPLAQEVVSPKTWIKEGRIIEKVFLYPDRPMRLYERPVKLVEEMKPIEAFLEL